jgi:hypothetical protein
MSKLETIQQSAEALNAQRLERLAQQMRESQNKTAEEWAALMEPLAQAMAGMTDETRATLKAVQALAETQAAQAREQIAGAAAMATTAAYNMSQAAAGLRGGHYALSGLVGALAGTVIAALVIASWLLLAPQTAVMDPEAIGRAIAATLECRETKPEPPPQPATARPRRSHAN